MPGLITDLVLSMDDRFLYFSNWLHGDMRQYDVSDPAKPKLTGQLWLGGVLGKGRRRVRANKLHGRPADAATQPGRQAALRDQLAVQQLGQPVLSRYGQGRSLVLLQIDCDTANGGMKLNERFFVDFGEGAERPCARPRDALSRRRLHLGHLDLGD